MLTKTQANRIRGLMARYTRCERALWALNTDNRNGCDFGVQYAKKVHADLANARAALFGYLRSVTRTEMK